MYQILPNLIIDKEVTLQEVTTDVNRLFLCFKNHVHELQKFIMFVQYYAES